MDTPTQNPQATRPAEFYSAELRVEDASVRISSTSMTTLASLIARLKTAAAPASAPFPPISAAVSAEEKQAAAAPVAATPPAPTAAPGKSAKSETKAAASSPTAAAPAIAASTVTYDDVKRVVTAIYAISPTEATELLKGFNVDNARKLTEAQWPDLVAQGDKLLAKLQKAAA